MQKLTSTIKSLLSTITKISIGSLVLNLVLIILLLTIGTRYLPRRGITVLIVISCIFVIWTFFSLQRNIVPLCIDSLFRSYEWDLDGLADQLTNWLLSVHGSTKWVLDLLGNKGTFLIKKVCWHLLDSDVDELIDSLDSDHPEEKIADIRQQLKSSLNEKINNKFWGRSLLLAHILIIVWWAALIRFVTR